MMENKKVVNIPDDGGKLFDVDIPEKIVIEDTIKPEEDVDEIKEPEVVEEETKVSEIEKPVVEESSEESKEAQFSEEQYKKLEDTMEELISDKFLSIERSIAVILASLPEVEIKDPFEEEVEKTFEEYFE